MFPPVPVSFMDAINKVRVSKITLNNGGEKLVYVKR